MKISLLFSAAYIPPEKQKHHAKRKFWSSKFNPSSEARIKMKKASGFQFPILQIKMGTVYSKLKLFTLKLDFTMK